MGAIRNFFLRRITRISERDLETAISLLKGMDGSEIAVVLVYATDIRHRTPAVMAAFCDFVSAGGPEFAGLLMVLNRATKRARDSGNNIEAFAFLIWLHSVRAAQDIALRGSAKRMWREIGRGFGHIAEAEGTVEAILGRWPNSRGARDFPDGLDPNA
jgi:hypothetical protein